MSSWDWFQSKYLYRRRAMAPNPQPMGGFGQPYEGADGGPARPITVNGPWNYGVFSPKTPYAFPSYYEDPHLESGRGYYSGFGAFGEEYTLPTGQKISVTCDAAAFVDKLMGKLSLPWPFSMVTSVISTQLKKAFASAFTVVIQKIAAGRAVFDTWFKINVSYNLAQAINASNLAQAVDLNVSQADINNTLLPLVWNPIQNTLNACKQSVGFNPDAAGYGPNSQPDGAICATNEQCISGACVGGKCVNLVKPLMASENWDFLTRCQNQGGTYNFQEGKCYGAMMEATLMLPKNLQLPAPPITTPPSGGGGGVGLLAAAAAAALLLLK